MTEPVLRVQAHLTDRDHTLLGWLYDHGVLTSFQIAHALFPSVDFAQERLRKLTQLKVVDRFRPQKPDGGSFPYHYLLDQLGVDVVAGQRGEPMPRRNRARERRWHLTSRANLPHLLGVNGFFTDLAGYARTHPDAVLKRWWSAAQCQDAGAFRTPGDQAAKAFLYRPTVRPDGHGIFTDHHGTVAFFLEYDTGTETIGRLVDKIDGYERMARVYQRIWPILFSLHSAARERHLHQALTDARIYYPVATLARDAHPGGSPAAALWWRHHHQGALLPLAALDQVETDDGEAPPHRTTPTG